MCLLALQKSLRNFSSETAWRNIGKPPQEVTYADIRLG